MEKVALLGSILLLTCLVTIQNSAMASVAPSSDEYEDLEISGDDFSDDEEEEVYSGSGSGYPDQEDKNDSRMKFTMTTSQILTTVPAKLPVTSVGPVATPFESVPTVGIADVLLTDIPITTLPLSIPEVTTKQEMTTVTTAKFPVIRVTPPIRPVARSTTTETTTTTAREATSIMATSESTTTATTTTTTTTSTASSTRHRTTTAARMVPKLFTTTTVTLGVSPTIKEATTEMTTTTVSPTIRPQTEGTLSTTINNEVEGPFTGGPSGDFEFPAEVDTDHPMPDNEVIVDVTKATGHGAGKDAGSNIIVNTIGSGNSAAQLPQKNILERKEVLIAVIVGGVVGALFAAFLVMLLIYRMKKKDEGSYTLEEPKQANITYQKPDKQEEFYA
ncbi:syndecan-3 [Protopterus annectens]|uniref:syndecan-3 n=1 Tax=Protopterus annectens TaxID=7888 RepID=UPI001CFA4A7C|nr:syndecan-3 [Protopterus annectens]